jgi:putative transcriptional regulator
MTESFTGNLLVASSVIDDPTYAGGVCLVVHQDESNVIGVMLNRPMKPNADALLAMLEEEPDSASPNSSGNRLASIDPTSNGDVSEESAPWRRLHFGGPLSGPVVAIHQVSQYAEAETGAGIYVAAQKHHLEDLLRRQVEPYRLIVGHVGWDTGQLEAEIEAGIWHIVPATVDTVFSSASEMWPRLIRRATSNSLARWLGVEDVIGAGELN